MASRAQLQARNRDPARTLGQDTKARSTLGMATGYRRPVCLIITAANISPLSNCLTKTYIKSIPTLCKLVRMHTQIEITNFISIITLSMRQSVSYFFFLFGF